MWAVQGSDPFPNQPKNSKLPMCDGSTVQPPLFVCRIMVSWQKIEGSMFGLTVQVFNFLVRQLTAPGTGQMKSMVNPWTFHGRFGFHGKNHGFHGKIHPSMGDMMNLSTNKRCWMIWNMISPYIGNNNPNWRTPSFFRGVGQPPTRQNVLDDMGCFVGESVGNHSWLTRNHRAVP